MMKNHTVKTVFAALVIMALLLSSLPVSAIITPPTGGRTSSGGSSGGSSSGGRSGQGTNGSRQQKNVKVSYHLWVGPEEVTGERLSGPGWSFDPSANTPP